MLVNLTPHAITLIAGEQQVTVPPVPAGPARCTTQREQVGSIVVDGVTFPVNRTRFGKITGLPARVAHCDDTQCRVDTLVSGGRCPHAPVYLVSAIVAQAAPDRDDLVIVDDTVRNDAGQVVGARAVARV